MKHKLLPVIACLFIFIRSAFSQCAVAPAFPGCSPAGSTPLVNGAVISSGSTMVFTGAATYANVTVDGGTLIVCGSLNITNFTVNSGTIYVNTGATLNYNGGGALVLGANTNYYNSGTSLFSGHVILNANTLVVNDFIFSTPFNYLVIQGLNAIMVNNYNLTCGGIMAWIPSSPSCLCLGGNSWTTVNYFYNRTANSIVVPSGNACLNVRQYADNTQPVTATSSLYVCVPSGISYSGAPNWGSATLNTNCNACLVTLPVELLLFEGVNEDDMNRISWSTASEENSCNFQLQRSADGVTFLPLENIAAAGYSYSQLDYESLDHGIADAEVYYYRLKQEDCNGDYTYSRVISLQHTEQNIGFVSSGSTGDYFGISDMSSVAEVSLMNSLGQVLSAQCIDGKFDLSAYGSGVYFIKVLDRAGKIYVYKVIKV
jgi:hypothetical protein